MKDFKKLPRLVGSIDEKISSIVSQIYTHVFGVEIISMPNCKTANAVKLTTNVFRDINIAFINELADGEVRKVKTGKILKTSKQADNPVYISKENEADKIVNDYHKDFINIINKAIDHQYDEFGEDSLGPNIDYVMKGNKRYYYAMIKQVENKEEIY